MRYCLTIDTMSNENQSRVELSNMLIDLAISVLSTDTSGEVRNSKGTNVGCWQIRSSVRRTEFIELPIRQKQKCHDNDEYASHYLETPEKY